jgi:hypothetical protein
VSSGVGERKFDVNPEDELEKVLTEFQKENVYWRGYTFYIRVPFGEDYKNKVVIYKERGYDSIKYKQVFCQDTPNSLGMGTDPKESYLVAKDNKTMYISS